jgi:ribosomal peptide maturation radical SAM protein 1
MSKKFALLSMPVQANELRAATLTAPVIASALRSSAIETDVFYFNLHFARYLQDKGFRLEELLKRQNFYYAINALLAELCWGTEHDESYFIKTLHLSESEAETAMAMKRHMMPFFERILASTDWGSYGAIGFSCSYYQFMASLIFSRMLKRKYPKLIVVFGGSFFEPSSSEEILKHEQHIDYIVEGYSDDLIVPLVQSIFEGKAARLQDVFPKNASARLFSRDDPAKPVAGQRAEKGSQQRLDRFGYPDFSDYARQYNRLFGKSPEAFDVEISRGCQKSQNSPCLFCNECRFEHFERKTAERFREELRYYHRHYGIKGFNINDSLIDVHTVISYLKPLEQEGFSYTVFGLFPRITREEMKTLAKLRVRNIQTGIESLQNHLLILMNKQNDVLNCINVLKWATHYGIFTYFNILFRIPGEQKEDYRQEIELINKLHHLSPGSSGLREISGLNDSPFCIRQEEFGVVRLGSDCPIADMFPESYDRNKIASSFQISYTGEGRCDEEIDELIKEVRGWKSHFGEGVRLTYEQDASGCITIRDSRHGAEIIDTLDEDCSLILPLLDEPAKFSDIMSGSKMKEEQLRIILDRLIAKDYVYANDSDCFISLAIPKK